MLTLILTVTEAWRISSLGCAGRKGGGQMIASSSVLGGFIVEGPILVQVQRLGGMSISGQSATAATSWMLWGASRPTAQRSV
jgi:hypothetical protein